MKMTHDECKIVDIKKLNKITDKHLLFLAEFGILQHLAMMD